MTTSCKICGSTALRVAYEGPIRLGRFGTLSPEPHAVRQCEQCGVQALPPIMGDLSEYYEGAQYREEVNAGAAAADYYRLHDAEQARNVGLTGTARFRGKVVMDVGCGAGSFLDAVQGYAGKVVAIEPSGEFQEELRHKGFETFSYPQDAHATWAGKVDVAVCFSVIEHVEDPVGFLRSIRALLAPGGACLLTTPNAGDLLVAALPGAYPSFFYRKVHLWYFDRMSLQRAFSEAGFSACEVAGHHRFGLGNFLLWLREQRPSGQASLAAITPAMDAVWKSELERTFACDYLFATAIA